MATAKEYFEKARRTLTFDQSRQLTLAATGEEITLSVSVAADFEANAKYMRLYADAGDQTVGVFLDLLPHLQRYMEEAIDGMDVTFGHHGTDVAMSSKDLVFTGRVTIHTPATISAGDRRALEEQGRAQGLYVVVRDSTFVAARNAAERPLAFISHDTRDKAFAAELARAFQDFMCPVWYDEYSLTVGDSLRESIEAGLKETSACVLVLSPRYFENAGWARREFDTIYVREVLEGSRRMLPVWLDVDNAQQVYQYSPILADRVGIAATLGAKEVARRIYNALSNGDA